MWKDPLTSSIECRTSYLELREEYASQFNHDADAIFEDIRKRQEKSDRKRVAFKPRRPVTEKQA